MQGEDTLFVYDSTGVELDFILEDTMISYTFTGFSISDDLIIRLFC